jgi:hypothetical protein
MVKVCCICQATIRPEDNRPGTVGDRSHGYCAPCRDWNHAAWAAIMNKRLTGEQFSAAIETRRRTGKFPENTL